MGDTVNRFTNRVAMYVRARPSYPYAVLRCLVETYGLGPVSTVADVGAGTGLLTRLLLTAGCTVHAVEPNDRMRAAADAMLGGHPGYASRPGTAESTGLADRSVDFVTAGPGLPLVRRPEGARRVSPHPAPWRLCGPGVERASLVRHALHGRLPADHRHLRAGLH